MGWWPTWSSNCGSCSTWRLQVDGHTCWRQHRGHFGIISQMFAIAIAGTVGGTCSDRVGGNGSGSLRVVRSTALECVTDAGMEGPCTQLTRGAGISGSRRRHGCICGGQPAAKGGKQASEGLWPKGWRCFRSCSQGGRAERGLLVLVTESVVLLAVGDRRSWGVAEH